MGKHGYLRRLDETGWPQRLAAWILARQHRRRAQLFRRPRSGATEAVCLNVSSPLLARADLFALVVPDSYGGWYDSPVLRVALSKTLAVALLREQRSGIEFALVMPLHTGFRRARLRGTRVLRLTCETERTSLMTVRTPEGTLIAAGTLELHPSAAFSREAVR